MVNRLFYFYLRGLIEASSHFLLSNVGSQFDQAGNLLTLTVLVGRNLAPPGANFRPTVVQPEAELNQIPFNQSITYKFGKARSRTFSDRTYVHST